MPLLADILLDLNPGDDFQVHAFRAGARLLRRRDGILSSIGTVGHPEAGCMMALIDRLVGTRPHGACHARRPTSLGLLDVASVVSRGGRARRRSIVVRLLV